MLPTLGGEGDRDSDCPMKAHTTLRYQPGWKATRGVKLPGKRKHCKKKLCGRAAEGGAPGTGEILESSRETSPSAPGKNQKQDRLHACIRRQILRVRAARQLFWVRYITGLAAEACGSQASPGPSLGGGGGSSSHISIGKKSRRQGCWPAAAVACVN